VVKAPSPPAEASTSTAEAPVSPDIITAGRNTSIGSRSNNIIGQSTDIASRITNIAGRSIAIAGQSTDAASRWTSIVGRRSRTHHHRRPDSVLKVASVKRRAARYITWARAPLSTVEASVAPVGALSPSVKAPTSTVTVAAHRLALIPKRHKGR
jgi:hypothetical protein